MLLNWEPTFGDSFLEKHMTMVNIILGSLTLAAAVVGVGLCVSVHAATGPVSRFRVWISEPSSLLFKTMLYL